MPPGWKCAIIFRGRGFLDRDGGRPGDDFLVEMATVAADYAGEAAVEKIENFLSDKPEKLTKAFEVADECFRKDCDDHDLEDRSAALPLPKWPCIWH